MHAFKVMAYEHGAHRPLGNFRVVGHRAPGPGVLVVKEGTGWVLGQDGSREDIDAMSVVTWDTGDWVEYGSDGGFKTDGYWAAQESEEESEARLSESFGSGAPE